MEGGFSFCGVDIASLGLEYAPELEDTYVYRAAPHDVHEETFDGHNGGYFYGVSRKPKEFVLRCAFEETDIDQGYLTKVYHLFRIGKSGKLVFKRRPWCYYYATVTDFDDKGITNYMNGIITIAMKAYYPFARYDGEDLYIGPLTPYYSNIMANSAFYDTESMVPDTTYTNLTTAQTLVLGNPGTEKAPLIITVAGNAGPGVIIRNITTGQETKIVAMSTSMTTDINKVVRIDGISGKTTLSNEDGTDPSIAFLYHNGGFIDLEPGFPAERNRAIEAKGTSKYIRIRNNPGIDYTNKHVFIDGNWYRIVKKYPNSEVVWELESTVPASQSLPSDQYITINTTIMQMNEIIIQPVATMNLSKLILSFTPTFA